MSHRIYQNLFAKPLEERLAFVIVEHLEIGIERRVQRILAQEPRAEGVDRGDARKRQHRARANQIRSALALRWRQNTLVKHGSDSHAHVIGCFVREGNGGNLRRVKRLTAFDLACNQRDEAARQHFSLA